MTISLDNLRTTLLNVDLGLTSDSDDRFGSTSVRNVALQTALRRLWPRMALFDDVTLTITEGTIDYSISTLVDVLWLELVSDSSYQTLDNFTQWYTGSAAIVRLPTALSTSDGWTLTAYGYRPYAVPATGSATTDLPDDRLWVAIAGARQFLYERQLNSFMTYERHENENRKTFLTPDQMLTMAASAERMFQEGLRLFPRTVTRARRAIPVR